LEREEVAHSMGVTGGKKKEGKKGVWGRGLVGASNNIRPRRLKKMRNESRGKQKEGGESIPKKQKRWKKQ